MSGPRTDHARHPEDPAAPPDQVRPPAGSGCRDRGGGRRSLPVQPLCPPRGQGAAGPAVGSDPHRLQRAHPALSRPTAHGVGPGQPALPPGLPPVVPAGPTPGVHHGHGRGLRHHRQRTRLGGSAADTAGSRAGGVRGGPDRPDRPGRRLAPAGVPHPAGGAGRPAGRPAPGAGAVRRAAPESGLCGPRRRGPALLHARRHRLAGHPARVLPERPGRRHPGGRQHHLAAVVQKPVPDDRADG